MLIFNFLEVSNFVRNIRFIIWFQLSMRSPRSVPRSQLSGTQVKAGWSWKEVDCSMVLKCHPLASLKKLFSKPPLKVKREYLGEMITVVLDSWLLLLRVPIIQQLQGQPISETILNDMATCAGFRLISLQLAKAPTNNSQSGERVLLEYVVSKKTISSNQGILPGCNIHRTGRRKPKLSICLQISWSG